MSCKFTFQPTGRMNPVVVDDMGSKGGYTKCTNGQFKGHYAFFFLFDSKDSTTGEFVVSNNQGARYWFDIPFGQIEIWLTATNFSKGNAGYYDQWGQLKQESESGQKDKDMYIHANSVNKGGGKASSYANWYIDKPDTDHAFFAIVQDG